MICNPSTFATTRSTLATHITDEVTSLCGETLGLNADSVAELAQAVESFVADSQGEGAVDANYLMMLTSRALTSLGEGPAARRLLLFGTGLVTPAEWEISGDAAMWTIDLRQITLRPDASLELVFFSSLHLILESMADVWDNTAGSGVLGLRHVCRSAAVLLGGTTSRRKVKRLAAEILDNCIGKLEQIGAERGWDDAPHVMDLDF